MDEKEREREREKDTASRIGCDISSRSSSMRKKKKNSVMDSINQIGSFLSGSSRRMNEASSKRRKSQIDISQKTKERDKKMEDFDKDRIIDSYRREIGSHRDKDKDKDRDRDRDREREVELGLGPGVGCIPASDITAPQDQALQGTASRGGRGEGDVEEDEEEHRRQESIGTFPTVNDGVSSVDMAMWSNANVNPKAGSSGGKDNPRPDKK